MTRSQAAGGKVSADRRGKRRDLVELALAYGLILLVVWTPRPWQRMLWWVAAAAIAIMTAISFDGLRTMGLRAANFFRSLWVVAMALAIATAAAALAGRLHTLHLPAGGPLALIANYWAYALWACVQQFLLQCFFLLRLLRLLPSQRWAAFAASAVFAAAHLPNPVLTPITFVWGLFACLVFLRYRNLYPLALAHALLGIAISVSIPGTLDHNMRVGLGYLTYAHRIHPARPASTQP
jgi:hypothetical protein